MSDQPGVLLGPAAVLPFVAAGEQPAAADGEARGHDPVHTQLLAGRADVALGRGRDDDGVVPLALMPLEPSSHVVAQMALQMAMGEDGGATIHLGHRQSPEQAGEQFLLDLVGRRAAGDGGPHEGGGESEQRRAAREGGPAG